MSFVCFTVSPCAHPYHLPAESVTMVGAGGATVEIALFDSEEVPNPREDGLDSTSPLPVTLVVRSLFSLN